MLTLLIVINLLPIIGFILFAVISGIKKHRFYHSVFRTLPLKIFYTNNNYVYSHHSGEDDDGFVWFLEDNSFCLSKGRYLSYIGPDLVKRHWKRKFQNWFKENVKLEYLPLYYNRSSYPSNIKSQREFPSAHTYDSYLRRYYAAVALRSLAKNGEPTEEVVRNAVEIANKLVAELRFKEKKESEYQG